VLGLQLLWPARGRDHHRPHEPRWGADIGVPTSTNAKPTTEPTTEPTTAKPTTTEPTTEPTTAKPTTISTERHSRATTSTAITPTEFHSPAINIEHHERDLTIAIEQHSHATTAKLTTSTKIISADWLRELCFKVFRSDGCCFEHPRVDRSVRMKHHSRMIHSV